MPSITISPVGIASPELSNPRVGFPVTYQGHISTHIRVAVISGKTITAVMPPAFPVFKIADSGTNTDDQVLT